MLKAALSGDLLDVKYLEDPLFRFLVPKKCPGVPDDVLNPASSWPDQDSYMRRYRSLASRFIDNFKKYALDCPPEVIHCGPKL